MANSNGTIMVYRLSWVAGLAGIALALGRAGTLLRPSIEGAPWQVVMVAAVALGAAITWAAVTYRLRGRWVVLANVVAALLALVRIAVPETTWFIFPTGASFSALSTELAFAREVIGAGIAPVIPLAGIVAILAVVFWTMGTLITWGLLSNRPYVAVLTPLIVYLEFAVMDRRPAGVWSTWFMVMIGLSLLAVSLDQRRSGTGLLTSRATRRSVSRSVPSLGLVVLATVVAITLASGHAVANLVPRTGFLDWRASTSLTGEYLGSIQYNPFVGIRQSLVSTSNVPVFAADITGDLDGRLVYWRLLTLDSFDGQQWYVDSGSRINSIDDIDRFEPASAAFAGPTTRVTASVTIAALQMDWLPAPYAPVALASPNETIERGVRVKHDDGSLRFDALTYRGMNYTITSDIPQPDLEVLALRPDGTPSIVFAGAIAAGELVDIAPRPTPSRVLPDRDTYLLLPDDLGTGISGLARQQAIGLESDYERALALESFFRTPGTFRYSTQIVPGHSATSLEAWLVDPASPNYRLGYCEQFATAMAVMARTLGIPSRVVLGFTPGTYGDDGRVIVRDRNAHAWVELWMPTQGWVRFDPTPRGDGVNPAALEEVPFNVARYLEVEVPVGEVPTSPPTTPQLIDEEPVAPGATPTTVPGDADDGFALSVPTPVVVMLGLLFLALALPLLKWQRRRSRLRRLAGGDIRAAWAEVVDRLRDLGDHPHPAATPAEIARGTTPALVPLARLYSETAYGPATSASSERVSQATQALRDTEFQLMFRYSSRRRLVARYSLGSILPGLWGRSAHSRRSQLPAASD